MLGKAPVFSRQHRVDQRLRNLAERNDLSALTRQRRQQAAITGKDLGDARRQLRVARQVRRLGQAARKVHVDRYQHMKHHHDQPEGCEQVVLKEPVKEPAVSGVNDLDAQSGHSFRATPAVGAPAHL